MKSFGVRIGVAALLLASMAVADSIPAKSPVTQPVTSQPAVVSLSDRKALDANIGKDAIVEGTVSEAAWSASGKVFLIKFKEGETTEFQGALFAKLREEMEKAFAGDLSNTFEGAKIRMTGKLQIYREHPEILINDPKQITILAKGAGNAPHAEAAKQ